MKTLKNTYTIMRSTISPDNISEQALEQEAQMKQDSKFYYATIESIRNAIDDIYNAKRKITYALIANRMQLTFPGITATELWQTYGKEITAYTEQYD